MLFEDLELSAHPSFADRAIERRDRIDDKALHTVPEQQVCQRTVQPADIVRLEQRQHVAQGVGFFGDRDPRPAMSALGDEIVLRGRLVGVLMADRTPDLSLVPALSAAGFAGVMLSPLHLCMVFTREYFDTEYVPILGPVALATLGVLLTGLAIVLT